MVSSILSSAKLQRSLLGVLVALVAAIAVVVITDDGSGSRTAAGAGHASSIFRGPTMPAHLRAPNFTLTNQNGSPVTLGRDRGHVVVLTFIHSKCHDACPFMTQQIRGALNDLPAHGTTWPPSGSASTTVRTPR